MLAPFNLIRDILVLVNLLSAFSFLHAVIFGHFDDSIESACVVVGEIREDVCVFIMACLYGFIFATDALSLGPSRKRSFLLFIIAFWSLLFDSSFVDKSAFADVFAFVVPDDNVFSRWVLTIVNVISAALIA